MDNEKIEALLERIALAIERLADAVIDGAVSQNDSFAQSLKNNDESTVEAQIGVVEEKEQDSVLLSFLEHKGISIKALPQQDGADQVIDSLALYLGERYDALAGILAKIKRAMQKGLSITESLKDRSQKDVSSVCQFCTRLHEVAFLEQYKYFRSPTYLIKAKTTTLPKAQNFFAGQWLERYILQKVKAVYRQISAEVDGQTDFECLLNPQIVLPNGDDFELDILTSIGPSIYWIEAKSGDYQQHVSKYSRFAHTLGLDYEHSFMVLTDVSGDKCRALSSLFSMTVCNLQNFEETLLNVARKDTAQQSASPDGNSAALHCRR